MKFLIFIVNLVLGYLQSARTADTGSPATEVPEEVPSPPTATVAPVDSTTEIVALTVWAEARWEPIEGIQGVTWVIKNRAAKPGWWGTDLKSVCLKPYQFSCWLPSDPQSKRLADPATKELDSYKNVLGIVQEVLRGNVPDPTKGSNHYCTEAVAPATKWAKDATPQVKLGSHLFYRL